MDYTNYQCEDFIENASFQSYIRKERQEDIHFWEKWISEHPGKLNEFQKASRILTDLNLAYSDSPSVSKEEELEKLLKKLASNSEADMFRTNRLFQVFRYAAVLILLLGIGFLLKITVFKSNSSNHTVAYKEIKTPKGKRLRLELSDGTHIWVNSESTIKYPEEFSGNDRRVYLEGEAFFDVAEDKTKPFYVYAGDVRVKVLGTKFNVRSYPEDNFIEATLEAGKIDLERINSKEKLISMLPNEKVTLYKRGVEPQIKEKVQMKPAEPLQKIESREAVISKNVETGIYTAWKDEKLVFKSEPLSKLKSRLERWYNVSIKIEDDLLYEKKFTGTFVKEPINEALKALSAASEMDFEIKQDTVFLKLKEHN